VLMPPVWHGLDADSIALARAKRRVAGDDWKRKLSSRFA
jgi:hypothetical protein